ncbi:DUF4493 domain-containing protein [Flammeovirga pectinis]|uniref:DUF4493 domain-containing protein n=1 Tax=Flammeovirga pectinis TaxID=2494373 RepID=A0A3Q9FV83_9BACT|nr:DUF4493 domain-containing protein [Flammeovirga pectinis]AZQ65350.1 DUF4493 domain-containing protein [Flammeovirga pectinis]
MQTTLKAQVLCILLFLGLFSCTTEETDQEPVEYTGTFSLNIALDNTTEVSFGRIANTTSTDNFLVKILKNDEEVAVFDNYADMAQQEELEVGKYSILVTSGEEQPAAFDNPLYSATQEFTITNRSNTAIDITCALLNAKVKLTFSDTFKNKYPAASADVYTEDALLNFTENKEGFFSIVENTISPIVRVNYTKEDVDRVKLTQFSELKSNYEVAVIVNYNQENDVVFFGEEYTPMTEKEVLMEIKETLHPNGWYFNWEDDIPFNEWNGVNVNENGFIDSLDLHIIKPLPASIENLTHLKTLEISHRTIGGGISNENTFPIQFFSMNQLTSLTITSAKFNFNNIFNFVNLEKLDFSKIFSEKAIGSNLSSLKKLKFLDIKTYPKPNYPDVNKLAADFNNELGMLTQLEFIKLDIDNDSSLVIPPNIGNFSNLHYLDIENKNIHSIPMSIGNLKKLTEIKIVGTEIKIPNELYYVTSLKKLSISNISEQEISSLIYNLENLTYLSLIGKLKGNIPNALGNLTNLTYLILEGDLTGTIPNAIANLDKLTNLYLSGNNLTGSIISEIGLMESLVSLGLQNNLLTGEIPKELGNLSKLEYIGFSNNQLSGSIPQK